VERVFPVCGEWGLDGKNRNQLTKNLENYVFLKAESYF